MNKHTPLDPVFGPLSKEEFAALIPLPAGEAARSIQKVDPFWGRQPGEKIRFKVRVRSTGDEGTAYVEAASQKEADKLADDLDSSEIDWDYDSDYEVVSVEPDMDVRLRAPLRLTEVITEPK